MVQNSIQHCWPQSQLIVKDAPFNQNLDGTLGSVPHYLQIVIIIAIILFMLFYPSIFFSIKHALWYLVGNTSLKELSNNRTTARAIKTTALLSISAICVTLHSMNLLSANLLYLMIAAAIYVTFHSISLRITAWFSKSAGIIQRVRMIGCLMVINMSILLIIPTSLTFISDSLRQIGQYTIYFLFFLLFFLYIWRIRNIFLEGRFSHLFLILYLCGLEFLPIGLFISAIV